MVSISKNENNSNQVKKVIVLGATDNPERYAYKAVAALMEHGYEVIPVGIRNRSLFGKQIVTDRQSRFEGVDTISVYVGPRNQKEWFDFILENKPRRLILNPGTENPELEKWALQNGIEVVKNCTLVMLGSGIF